MCTEDYVDNFYTDALYPNNVSKSCLLYTPEENIIGEIPVSGYGTLIVNAGIPSVSPAIQVNNNIVRMPLQPFFAVYMSETASKVTGDGTNFTIPFDKVVSDQSSNFDPKLHAFIAPVDGFYQLSLLWRLNGVALASNILIQASIQGASLKKFCMSEIGSGICDKSNNVTQNSYIYLQLDSGDAVTFEIRVSGQTNSVDVAGGGLYATSLYGKLV